MQKITPRRKIIRSLNGSNCERQPVGKWKRLYVRS
jgi:hypothetical protein